MHPDTVQIGSLVISKSIFDALMVMLGVITGGLIAFLTTTAIEKKRWEAQKADRTQEHRREALALALEWIPPIELALEKAVMLASGYLRNETSEKEFSRQWPNLLHELAIRDLPMRLNVLVPDSIQQRTNAIIEELRSLQSFTFSVKPVRNVDQSEWMKRFHAFSDQASKLRNEFTLLKQELISEYKKTFA